MAFRNVSSRVRRPPKLLFSREEYTLNQPLEQSHPELFGYIVELIQYSRRDENGNPTPWDGRYCHSIKYAYEGNHQNRNVRKRGKKEGYGVENKKKMSGDPPKTQTTIYSKTFPTYREAALVHDSVERAWQSGNAEEFLENEFEKEYLKKCSQQKRNDIERKVRSDIIHAKFEPKRLHYPTDAEYEKCAKLNQEKKHSNFARVNYNRHQDVWLAEASRSVWKAFVKNNSKSTIKGIGKCDVQAAINFEWQVYLLNHQKLSDRPKSHQVFNRVLHGYFDAIFFGEKNITATGRVEIDINDDRFWFWGAYFDENCVVTVIEEGAQFWLHGVQRGWKVVGVKASHSKFGEQEEISVGRKVDCEFILQKMECTLIFESSRSTNDARYDDAEWFPPSEPLSHTDEEMSGIDMSPPPVDWDNFERDFMNKMRQFHWFADCGGCKQEIVAVIRRNIRHYSIWNYQLDYSLSNTFRLNRQNILDLAVVCRSLIPSGTDTSDRDDIEFRNQTQEEIPMEMFSSASFQFDHPLANLNMNCASSRDEGRPLFRPLGLDYGSISMENNMRLSGDDMRGNNHHIVQSPRSFDIVDNEPYLNRRDNVQTTRLGQPKGVWTQSGRFTKSWQEKEFSGSGMSSRCDFLA